MWGRPLTVWLCAGHWTKHWVFWAGPMSGAAIAALTYEFTFRPSHDPVRPGTCWFVGCQVSNVSVSCSSVQLIDARLRSAGPVSHAAPATEGRPPAVRLCCFTSC